MNTHRPLIIEPVALDTDTLCRPVSFSDMFGNDNAVEIEIGCGKGTFITEQAKARKDTNFVGLEWARFYWRFTCDRLRRAGCANARVARAEAGFFLDEFVPASSVSVLHIYFPDPWPKARHHKRRLIQPHFMSRVHRVLKPGGRLQIVTDHANYWETIEPTVRGSVLDVVDYDRPVSAQDGEFVGTNFERKYRREGRPFFAIAAVKM